MKKIIIILIVVFLLAALGFSYLNRVVLPQKLQAMIVKGIGDATQKKVSLGSLSFNIFKGLVLRDLAVYDEKGAILKVKEIYSPVLIMPFFKKQIILPSLKIRYPVLALERRADNSFNISDIFVNKQPRSSGKPSGFALLVPKVSVIGGKVEFRDNTCSPAFVRQADKLNLVVYLSLPVKVRFRSEFSVPQPAGSGPAAKVNASGEYNIATASLSARVMLKGLAVHGLDAYLRGSGISLPGGNLDASLNLGLNGNILKVGSSGQIAGLNFSKDKISGMIDSLLKGELSYDLSGKRLDYSGKMDISNAEISGIDLLGKISGIKGTVRFSPKELVSEDLRANVLGLNVEAKAKLSDFANPLFNLEAGSEAGLDTLLLLLKDRFAFNPAVEVSGRSRISVELIYQAVPGAKAAPQISGAAEILNAGIKLKDSPLGFEAINGPLNFDLNGLAWENVSFKYSGADYRTSGTLVNFKNPGVRLDLSSEGLAVNSAFSFTDKKLIFSELSGRYYNSEFSALGNIDLSSAQAAVASVAVKSGVDLKDLKGVLKKFQPQLEKIAPQGLVRIEGTLNGNIKDIRSCIIEATASSDSLVLYGLKSSGLSLDYRQENGLAEVPFLHLDLYDGYIEAAAKMNLASENFPYWINAVIAGVKIEKLKNDTGSRDKDIAGTVQAQVKLNGFSSDLSRLSGAGRIVVTEGRLWQLNLFQGIGALIFTSDFTNIVFNEGSCSFSIGDKYIYTDDLKLRSILAVLSGEVKISFDGSLEAALNTEVSPEAPLSGTVKDITTAILGQASKIGVIRISGTLKEPKFKFKPAVVDIIKSIKDTFFGK